MVIDSIAVCGDSFGCGSGMPQNRCYEDSFGGYVSKKLDLPLKVYARSGCCNFTIFLQVKKVIDQFNHKVHAPLVLVTLTNHARLTFPIDSTKISTDCDLRNVDYRKYEPYSNLSSPTRPIHFDLSDEPNLLSETISNMNLGLKGRHMRNDERFDRIMDRKWKAISMYFEEIYDDSIKMHYDVSIATMMHLMLKEAGLPHVIFGFGRYMHRFIPDPNFVEIHWGSICMNHPDEGRSGHCNAVGHAIVAEKILPSCRVQLGNLT
jgi:hypothetical protein